MEESTVASDLTRVILLDKHMQLLCHPNLVCVLCLLPSHPALQQTTEKIDFNITSDSKGKRKKKAQFINVGAKLCTVTSGGIAFDVTSCVRGKLLEVNDRLLENPEFLRCEPDNRGHIAVILEEKTCKRQKISKNISANQIDPADSEIGDKPTIIL